jgi:cell division initiation protein
MELTPESIRDVRFRQALRGYNPEDVDAFITRVVEAFGETRKTVAALEARALEAESRTGDASDIEESLRRTLVLAQRTADLAIKEAQDEAAKLLADAEERRDEIVAEADELKSQLVAEAEDDVREERERLHAERDALERDVESLQAYLALERERLRIYFAEQLRRVEEGVPGVQAPPVIETAVAGRSDAAREDVVVVEDPPVADPPLGGDVEANADDPFLAELRRAVTDTEPLGPRDDEEPVPAAARNDGSDMFEEADSGGRFLRRRR